jgi:hypothetical protein
MRSGEGALEGDDDEDGDWAEQPIQISKRTTNARRKIINCNHLNMTKMLDYLTTERPVWARAFENVRSTKGVTQAQGDQNTAQNDSKREVELILLALAWRIQNTRIGVK